MAGWGRAGGRERWLLCAVEKVQEGWCCRQGTGRARAGHGQGMGSQSLGHEQRVSNTTGLIINLAWGCFTALCKGCVHTEPW